MFSIGNSLASGGKRPASLVAGNFNLDQNLDVALSNQGIATTSVQVRDNGGTDASGNDRSAIQAFQIKVTDLADGQANNTVTLDATEFVDHDVLLSDGQLVVRAIGKALFSAPAGRLDRVKLAAPTGSSTYEIQAPSSHLFGTLQYRKSGQSVTMVPAIANVDLTRIPNGALQGVEVLDFTALSAQTLMFNAANIASFNAEKAL